MYDSGGIVFHVMPHLTNVINDDPFRDERTCTYGLINHHCATSSSWDLMIYFLDLFDYSASWGGSQEICMIMLKSKWYDDGIYVWRQGAGLTPPRLSGRQLQLNGVVLSDFLFVLPHDKNYKSGLSLSWPRQHTRVRVEGSRAQSTLRRHLTRTHLAQEKHQHRIRALLLLLSGYQP